VYGGAKSAHACIGLAGLRGEDGKALASASLSHWAFVPWTVDLGEGEGLSALQAVLVSLPAGRWVLLHFSPPPPALVGSWPSGKRPLDPAAVGESASSGTVPGGVGWGDLKPSRHRPAHSGLNVTTPRPAHSSQGNGLAVLCPEGPVLQGLNCRVRGWRSLLMQR
jgi:hypothetical protein